MDVPKAWESLTTSVLEEAHSAPMASADGRDGAHMGSTKRLSVGMDMPKAGASLTTNVLEEVHLPTMASAGDEVGDAEISGPGKEQYEEEIASLVKLFNEEERLHVVTRYRKNRETVESIQPKKIAALLEGSRLPFASLVKDIFNKLSGENDQDQAKSGAVTMDSVKMDVLKVGMRLKFGITNSDVDVLEDNAPASLWCWHTREWKFLPKAFHEEVSHRRRCREKIKERVSALSATIDALRSADEALTRGDIELMQQAASLVESRREALTKVDDESSIRAAKAAFQKKKESSISAQAHPTSVLGEQADNLNQEEQLASKKRRSDPMEKERIRQEKLLKREQIENEKEQKRKEKEEADRKKQQQKQQDEAEKERRRKEKEEGERKKQEKKRQDEAEKEQKREDERKKQLVLKKQATIMDRFFIRKSTCGRTQQPQPQSRAASSSPVAELEKRESVSSSVRNVGTTSGVVARMDAELKGCRDVDCQELLRSHVKNWISIRDQCASNKPNWWGVRRKPKVSVYRELRLSGTVNDIRGNSQYEDPLKKGAENSTPSQLKRVRDEFDTSEDVEWKENVIECLSPNSPPEEGKKSSSTSRYHQVRKKKRKLLQFDKSHRPPYYGTFSKSSDYIKPCHPFTRDPSLDYEVDSDEEWEEEEPGESLSDAENDEEDENVEEIEDDDDSRDEFVVPDGYLSEDEGVAMEDSERGVVAVAGGSSENQSPVTPVHQGVMSREQLRKALDDATAHAIRVNHPLVISNLGQLPGRDDDTRPAEFQFSRVENMCLEALKMRVLVPNLLIGAC